MKINRCITPYNKREGRRGYSVEWIVMHYTANEERHGPDTAKGEATYAASQYFGTSAHFYVDEREVWQSVPINDTAWHCNDSPSRNGAYNVNSIGIEMCNQYRDGTYTILPETVDNAVELVLMLLNLYPEAKICRHYDVTGKRCPGPWVDDPRLWRDFLKKVEEGKPMTKEEREEMNKIEAEVKELDERTAAKYNSVEECPDWAQPTVSKLVARGIIQGTGDGLGLTYSDLRQLVWNDRAGVYGS